MTVRVRLRKSLLAGLVAVLASASGGCSDSTSKTDLLGVPKVLNVMVTTPGPNSAIGTPNSCTVFDSDDACQDPLFDALSNYELTFGSQADLNLCGFDANEDRLGPCNPTAEGLALHCALTGEHKGHCVDSTENPPIVAHADPSGLTIRMVFGALLNGQSVERFACACQGTTFDALDEASCVGTAWTDDPFNCGGCGAAASDTSSQGKCLDTDNNGLPDISSLKPGLATITCGSLITGAAGSLGQGQGYYYPSGNQLLSSQIGLLGMGPALVFSPAFDLPVDTECTIKLTDAAKPKAGGTIEQAADGYKFRTDKLGVDGASSAPAADDTGVDPADPNGEGADLPQITIAFNTTMKTPALSDVVVKLMGGAAVPLDSVEADGNTLIVSLAGPLESGKTYEVSVKAAVSDTFNKTLGADSTPYTFETE
jgi:hypothetical protein